MARLAPLAGVALLVLTGGCIYVTGVQDYKVDDSATSGGGPPPTDDSACFAAPDGNTCRNCCVGHHPDDAAKFVPELQSCACQPDTCQTQCESDLCATGSFTPGGGCDRCVSNLTAVQCPEAASNTYFICARGCPP